jgi:hypothetical protein
MSIKVMSLVWDNFNRGGSEKLVMLAMADWCNDAGGSLYPSIATIAKKTNISDKQARRIVHTFIEEGYLSVVGNEHGGAVGNTRQYQFNLDKFTPPTHGSPPAGVTPPANGSTPLPPMSLTPPADGSQSVNNHQSSVNKKRVIKEKHSLSEYLEQCKTENVLPIPESDCIFEFCDKAKISYEFLQIAWLSFKDEFVENETKVQKDWKATFRNYVKKDYMKVWYFNKQGECVLTNKGTALKNYYEQGKP